MASILVVEDNIENMELAMHFLEIQGHHSKAAMDGEEALNLLNTHAFKLILLDMSLPKVDGFEVLGRLNTTINSDTPVIAVTACMLKKDEESFIAERCAHFLAKPFSMKQFHHVVSSCLNE